MNPQIPTKSKIIKSRECQKDKNEQNKHKIQTPSRKESQDHQSTSKSETKFLPLWIDTPSLKFRSRIPSKEAGCNCRRSMCLKMYCVCFSKGQMCHQSCFCEECRNKTDNIERSNAINAIITKDPFAFSKNSQTEGNVIGEKCNCKRSGCIKKYCDCFRLGLKCGEECGCVGCHNRGDKEKQKGGYVRKRVKIQQ